MTIVNTFRRTEVIKISRSQGCGGRSNKIEVINLKLIFGILLVIALVFCTVQNAFAQEKTIYLKAGLLYNSEQNTLENNKDIQIKGNRIISIGDYNSIPQKRKVVFVMKDGEVYVNKLD